jgi:hypothetical protein
MLKNSFLLLVALTASLVTGRSSLAAADQIENFNFEIGPILIQFGSFDPDVACPNRLKDWRYEKDDSGKFFSPKQNETLEVSADGKSVTGKITTVSAANLSSKGILPGLDDQSVLMNRMLGVCKETFPEHDCSVDPGDYLEAILPDENGNKTYDAYCEKPKRDADFVPKPFLSMTVLFVCECSRIIPGTQPDAINY